MKPFQFRNTHAFSEEEYREIHRVLPKKEKYRALVVLGLIAIACFFSSYTFILGLVILAFLAFDVFKLDRKITRFALKNTYRESKLLKKKLTYGISNNHLTIDGDGVSMKVDWSMIKVWELKERWLQIACDQIPAFYYDIEKLKEKNLLLTVLELCQEHGVMFDSKENKNRYNQAVLTTSEAAPPTS